MTVTEFARRCVVVGTAVGLCLVAATGAELLVRRFSPIQGVIFQPHPRYLYAHVADARRVYRHPPEDGGRWVMVRTDAEGRRSGAFTTPGARRILVVGDSFISAEYSPEPERFVHQLGLALDERGLRVDVINAGVTGYGPDQVVLYLEDTLSAFAPDLLIVGIFAGNDYGDLIRNKLFEVTGGELRPRSVELDAAMVSQFSRAAALSRFHLWRAARSVWTSVNADRSGDRAGASWADPVPGWLRARDAEYRDYLDNHRVRNLLADDYDIDMSVDIEADSSRYKIQLMRAVLARIAALAEAQASQVLFLNMPNIVDACERYQIQVDTRTHPSYRRARLTTVTQQLAGSLGLHMINLYPVLATSDCAERFYTAPSNGHWNAAGQRESAAVAAGYIVDRGLLSP